MKTTDMLLVGGLAFLGYTMLTKGSAAQGGSGELTGVTPASSPYQISLTEGAVSVYGSTGYQEKAKEATKTESIFPETQQRLEIINAIKAGQTTSEGMTQGVTRDQYVLAREGGGYWGGLVGSNTGAAKVVSSTTTTSGRATTITRSTDSRGVKHISFR